jgi:hypothetical protein
LPKSRTIFAKISDESVKEKTGKTWEHWFKVLDSFNVKESGHKLAASHAGSFTL